VTTLVIEGIHSSKVNLGPKFNRKSSIERKFWLLSTFGFSNFYGVGKFEEWTIGHNILEFYGNRQFVVHESRFLVLMQKS